MSYTEITKTYNIYDKPNMYGVCGWWRLREDHPLQIIANDFAKEFGTPKFPVHITYSYGDNENNKAWKSKHRISPWCQYTTQPWFDPVNLKGKICNPPSDNWSWFVLPLHPEIDVDIVRDNDNYSNVQSIRLRCELYPSPLDIPLSCDYHISLAYTIVDDEKPEEDEWGFYTPQGIYDDWISDRVPEQISLKNDDFTAELWDCSSVNIEEWHKL